MENGDASDIGRFPGSIVMFPNDALRVCLSGPTASLDVPTTHRLRADTSLWGKQEVRSRYAMVVCSDRRQDSLSGSAHREMPFSSVSLLTSYFWTSNPLPRQPLLL